MGGLLAHTEWSADLLYARDLAPACDWESLSGVKGPKGVGHMQGKFLTPGARIFVTKMVIELKFPFLSVSLGNTDFVTCPLKVGIHKIYQ